MDSYIYVMSSPGLPSIAVRVSRPSVQGRELGGSCVLFMTASDIPQPQFCFTLELEQLQAPIQI